MTMKVFIVSDIRLESSSVLGCFSTAERAANFVRSVLDYQAASQPYPSSPDLLDDGSIRPDSDPLWDVFFAAEAKFNLHADRCPGGRAWFDASLLHTETYELDRFTPRRTRPTVKKSAIIYLTEQDDAVMIRPHQASDEHADRIQHPGPT